MNIDELIIKNKIQSDTIKSLLTLKRNSKSEIYRYEACKRFIDGFIYDLEQIKQNNLK